MKTNVAHTSLESYDNLKSSNHLEPMQKKIVSFMWPGRFCTRRQLAMLTGIETSSIAGRVKELIDDGVIEVCGQIKCPVTNRMVEALTLAPVQMEIAA